MPDGLTHILAGYIALNRLNRVRLTLFLVGSLLPDIVLRGGRLFFVNHPLRDWFELYLAPFHTPIGGLFVCLAISQFFHHTIRKNAFLWLCTGCLAHFALDFLQRGIEGFGLKTVLIGGYYWLFPFSWYDFQLGLIWPEQTPYLLFLLVPLAVWIFYKRKNRGFFR